MSNARIIKEKYRGYDIYYNTHTFLRNYSIVQNEELVTSMPLASVKACRNVIDTYEGRHERNEEELLPKTTLPISEEKLNEVIDRPGAVYSNKDFNK